MKKTEKKQSYPYESVKLHKDLKKQVDELADREERKIQKTLDRVVRAGLEHYGRTA